MSAVLVRAALETALAAMSPALATVPENQPYTPVVGTPYQRVNLLLAEPANPEFGSLYTEQGIFQISLAYPLNVGSGAATARAELIRSTFQRGTTFTSGGVKVHVTRTPEISPGRTEDDRFVIPVKVRIHAHVGG